MSTTRTTDGPASTMPGLRPARRTYVRVLAWSILVLTVVLLVVSLAWDLAAPASGPGIELGPGFGAVYTLGGVIIAGCAVVAVRHDPRQHFGWALLAIAVVWALDGLSQSFVRYAVRSDDALPGANLALWYLNRFGAVLPLSIAALLLIFPTGRFMPGWLGRLGIAALTGMGLATLLALVMPATDTVVVAGLPPGIDLDLLSLPVPVSTAERLLPLSGVLNVAGVLVAMVTAVIRHRRSVGVERDQMRWLVWAVVVMALTLVLSLLADVGPAADAVLVGIAVLPVVAMTVGVVRPGVVPVESLLVRTVVLGAVALSLLCVDLVLVGVLTKALDGGLDDRQLVTVVLLLTVLAYSPLRRRLSLAVQGWFLGSRRNRYDVVAGLASSLESADEGSAQLAAVARAVADAFGVGYVAVEVDRSGGERLTATYGEAPDEVRSLPITYRDTVVGKLVLPARGMRSRLSARDEKLLGDLVRQAATAARSGQLAEQLQTSRERLVTAREEERRRIRRDLHDGLGPAMAGVVFQLETVKLSLDSRPEQARETLTAISGQVQDIVADVRRLVHELRPPALDDRGLVGALGQLVESLPVPVTIHADDLAGLPAAVEVAAYRIVAESLTNVARHARAHGVRVTLRRTTQVLEVEVADDGIGVAEDVQAGVGLLSVRERAAELGGHAEVSCPTGGGTVVRAVLPVATRKVDE